MAQPYDKTGGGGKKTLLSQEDLEKMDSGNTDMLFWGLIFMNYSTLHRELTITTDIGDTFLEVDKISWICRNLTA